MSIRVIVQTSLLAVSFSFMACNARTTVDAGVGGGTGGGGGKVDSGVTDSGTAEVDAGVAAPETISAAKRITFPGLVDLKGVVVTGVSFSAPSVNSTSTCFGSATKGTNASFWVADPANANTGIWVTKYRCDAPYDYAPAIGDVLNLKGYIGLEEGFNGREKKRFVVKQQFDFIFTNRPATCSLALGCQPLEIVKTGTMAALPDNVVDATFGANGAIKANSTYSGTRVKIDAPLTIADPRPLALKRLSLVPGDDRYFGFQLSNGVLVNDYLTYTLNDGGCDYRSFAIDAGVGVDGGTLGFKSIAGIWDTYTMLACVDGGIDSNCFKTYSIPGTDAGGYTNVLYPLSCSDFVQ